MNALIDTQEINEALFGHNREMFGPAGSSSQLIKLPGADGVNFSAKFYSSEESAPNLIFFPSCEISLLQLEEMAESYHRSGLNIFIVSYRVDNTDDTASSLAQFLEDGQHLFQQAVDWLKNNNYTGALFVMGQSLGAVAVIDVVYKNPDAVKAMILESAMCDTASYLQNVGLDIDGIDDLDARGFNNIEKIEAIKKPTLIFHGARDTRIPVAVAEKLQASSGARSKQFFIIPGGTHDFLYKSGGPLYYETIKKFIDTICGVNTWRQRRRKYKESREG